MKSNCLSRISIVGVGLLLLVLLCSTVTIEGKRKSSKSPKTKTKWSTSTENDSQHGNALLSTEEHGYYIKRTYTPLNQSGIDSSINKPKSPPYLAIPIAWFSCNDNSADGGCGKYNSVAINGQTQSLTDGFLCDDDCNGPYDPICGKTKHEVAVFYNKCKLNVAKCRTHGLWLELSYEECQRTYPEEVAYTDKKFKLSPFFVMIDSSSDASKNNEKIIEIDDKANEKRLEVALAALK